MEYADSRMVEVIERYKTEIKDLQDKLNVLMLVYEAAKSYQEDSDEGYVLEPDKELIATTKRARDFLELGKHKEEQGDEEAIF